MSAADDVIGELVARPPAEPLPDALGVLGDTALVAAVGAFRVGRRGFRMAAAVVRAVPVPRPSSTTRAGRALDDVTTRAADTRRSLERTAAGILDRVVPFALGAVLDRTDLTMVVQQRVDLDQLVAVVDIDAVAARIDLDAIVKRLDLDATVRQMDLVALTQEIMGALDIPEIIRESTTSVASGSVTEVRLQSISADEALARVVDRFRLRRRSPTANGPAVPPPPS
ncbi:hypothetical protein ACPPVT_17860 [Angustibacter sp. McL0619]|uniref:hypothetical protein n=1 Tax=Angustibacter sp. McL0619 TaxID=3415676 RepID=UPI003CF0B905